MKPRVKVFDYIWPSSTYFYWPGHGCWRVDDFPVPSWNYVQDNCYVPWVGF